MRATCKGNIPSSALPGPDPSCRDSLGACRKSHGASPCGRCLPVLFAYEEAEQVEVPASLLLLWWGAPCPCFASTVPIPPGAQCPQGATLKRCQAWHSSLGQGTRAGTGSLWRSTPGAQGPDRRAVLEFGAIPVLWREQCLEKR